MKTMVLVSCVKAKRPAWSRAEDLYESPWFKKAMAYAWTRGVPFVLSAKHGLVDIDAWLYPYEESLNRVGVLARKAWAVKVVEQIDELRMRRGFTDVVILAGERYREFLVPAIHRFDRVEIPMAGMGIGRQLQWLGSGSHVV